MILRKKEIKMKTERELFQKAYEKTDHYYINYEKTNASNSAFSWNGQENRYTWHDVNSAWEMWCASAQREGYKLVPVEPTYEMWSELSRHLGRYMQMHNRYCPKTLKKYFDRFIGEPPEWLSKEVGSWDSDHAFATADLPVFIYKAMLEAA